MKDVFTLGTVAIAVILLLITGIGATNFITPAYAPEPARPGPYIPPPLTGVWKSYPDGGTYYLRQIGDVVWWIGLSGENDGRLYSNIFRGTIITLDVYGRGIEGEWVDVPRGTNTGAGTMLLHISSPTIMYKISQTGGFGPDTWRKVG